MTNGYVSVVAHHCKNSEFGDGICVYNKDLRLAKRNRNLVCVRENVDQRRRQQGGASYQLIHSQITQKHIHWLMQGFFTTNHPDQQDILGDDDEVYDEENAEIHGLELFHSIVSRQINRCNKREIHVETTLSELVT